MVTKATVKFFPRTDFIREDKKIPIYVRVILNREKFDFSSRQVISTLKEWDEVTQRVKIPKSPINKELSEIEYKVSEAFDYLKYHNRPLTAYALRKQLKGTGAGQDRPKLIDYVDDYLANYVNNSPDYALATQKTYRTTVMHLKNFLNKTKRNGIRVAEVDLVFLKEFDTYLQTRSINEKKGVNKNSANKYHINFKAMLFKAADNKMMDKNPYMEFKFKSQPGKLTYLTSAELESLEKHSLGNNTSLERVRDIFLFSVYTGLRHSDASSLTQNNIEVQGKEYWICYTQQKTGDYNRIPMLKRAIEIYNKYKAERLVTGFVLPRLSNQKLNAYLKVVAELAGIKKHLSHHVARHTAATTIFMQNGISLETTGKLLGHRSIKSTQIYAKVTNLMLQEAAIKLNKIL